MLTNQYLLRIFGLQRSGIHAVVNWIVQQAPRPSLFINDIKTLQGNPYRQGRGFHWCTLGTAEQADLDLKLERRGLHAPKQYLVLGYEDKDIRRVPVGLTELESNSVGSSGLIKNIIIIRDPFNLFASRLAFKNSANRKPLRRCAKEVIALWKLHAQECLGRTCFLGPNTIFVKYNEWFQDRDYRENIASQLGLTFTDEGLEFVPGVELPKPEFARFGCGSSFDRVRFHGSGQQMNVLERWRHYAGDPFYRGLFDDKDLIQLSQAIFGNVVNFDVAKLIG